MTCPDCAQQQYRIDALLIDLQNAEADLTVKRRQITVLKRENDELLNQVVPMRSLADVVFAYWRMVLHPRAREFGRARRKVVSARLKAMTEGENGMSTGEALLELMRAIDGASHGAYVKDGKPYDDLELICRDAVNVARFVARQDRWEHRLDAWMAAQWPEACDPDWYSGDDAVVLPGVDGQARMHDLRAA